LAAAIAAVKFANSEVELQRVLAGAEVNASIASSLVAEERIGGIVVAGAPRCIALRPQLHRLSNKTKTLSINELLTRNSKRGKNSPQNQRATSSVW
jgi:hypothetical protein